MTEKQLCEIEADAGRRSGTLRALSEVPALCAEVRRLQARVAELERGSEMVTNPDDEKWNQEVRRRAREQFRIEGVLEIDDAAPVTPFDRFASYVQARITVGHPERSVRS